MLHEFDKPLEIISVKAGDTVLFSADVETPYEPVLNVYDIDYQLLHGPVAYDTERNGVYHWQVTADGYYGMADELTYYIVEISDDLTGYTTKRYMVYVNDNLNYEGMIDRALGLAGHNIRKFSHTWSNGLLTGFDIKIYETDEALELAESGGTDTFLAHYRVACRYDNNYNRYETTSTRIA